jgi:retinol dehydrogenase-14
MHGKRVLVTGANSGIGYATAQNLARRGADLVMVCRNLERGEDALDRLRQAVPGATVKLMLCDLASMDSIRRFAATYRAEERAIDVLINNAGVYVTEPRQTADGLELMIGTNHVGTFLLTNLLLPKLHEAEGARVVVVASLAHTFQSLKLTEGWTTYWKGAFRTYGRSKLANILFTRELARRLEGTGITAYSLHPGVVATNLGIANWPIIRNLQKYVLLSAEKGARTSIFLATTDAPGAPSGAYFANCKPVKTTKMGADMELAARLWSETAKLAGTH